MSRRRAEAGEADPRVRCAIYTRKSTEEGLSQEFNSLDAQREGAEAFVASQKAEGWIALPDRYDDGGFTGGNTERPALQRMLADIAAGKIDCVVVYKVDRLSRSLLDFTKILETFERHGVSFVSVTQQFNTSHSMGRLTLNILLSFAQFEREIIGERIRDKLAAQRRKGKWAGGKPVLGYDVDRSGSSPRLVVNRDEAARVRAIFDLYLENGSMLPVVTELARRTWSNKAWTTRGGKPQGGRPFDRPTLYALLTNPLYAGRISHKGEQFAGEHEALITTERFAEVQQRLAANGRRGCAEPSGKSDVLLRGLLKCRACGCSMVHVLAGSGKRRYRYYVCSKANRTSRALCPAKSLPAAEIERAVVDEIRGIIRDRSLVKESRVRCPHCLGRGGRSRLARRSPRRLGPRPRSTPRCGGLARSTTAQARTPLGWRRSQRKCAASTSGASHFKRSSATRRHHRHRRRCDERARRVRRAVGVDGTARTGAHRRAPHRARRFRRHRQQHRDRVPRRRAEGARGGHLRGGRMITVRKTLRFGRGPRGQRLISDDSAPTVAAGPRVPRIARLMALAIRFDRLLREGTVRDLSELARLARITQPRATQIMNLTLLAPDIQEEILLLLRAAESGREPIHERRLRPIVALAAWNEQRRGWRRLVGG
jgi:site-specific DNA recombinase